MKLLLAIVGSVLLLCVTGFSVFGFLATLEPTNNPSLFIALRIGCSVVSVGCLIGVIMLIGSTTQKWMATMTSHNCPATIRFRD